MKIYRRSAKSAQMMVRRQRRHCKEILREYMRRRRDFEMWEREKRPDKNEPDSSITTKVLLDTAMTGAA